MLIIKLIKVTSKRLLFVIFVFILCFIFPRQILAQNLLFSDDFEVGNISDKWRYISGTWSRETYNGSVWARIASTEFKDNEIQSGDSSWTNYSLNLDIFKIEGEDINLFFRIQDSRYLNLSGHNLPVSYGLHMKHNRFALQKFTDSSGVELQITSADETSFLNSSLKHIEIKLENNNIKVFADYSINPIIDYTDNDFPYLNGGVALASITGTAGTNVRFDNVIVTQLTSPTAMPEPTIAPTAVPTSAPTPTPTATPTMTASPTPTAVPTVIPTTTSSPTGLISLSVPSLKQYSLPWKNKIYAFTKNTINDFGCALTSAAMVLQYHGHTVNPDSLNDWLKQQPDGYIASNLVNWLAITRYTKQHDSLLSPTLEYKRMNVNNNDLDNELINRRPAILKETGHFVVATGKTNNSYLINDPGYSNRNTLLSYNNNYLAINAFRPTHSDLSYIMLVTNPNISVELFDSSNQRIDIQSYIDEGISNLNNPNTTTGNSVKIVLFEKPANGKYRLVISGQGKYDLDSYIYDVNGTVTKDKHSGKLARNDKDTYKINVENKKKNKEKEKDDDHDDWKEFFRKFLHKFKTTKN